MVDERYNGKVVGLMGNFDGNSTNDFVLPNNTILFGSAVNSERKIYENFGQRCEYFHNFPIRIVDDTHFATFFTNIIYQKFLSNEN